MNTVFLLMSQYNTAVVPLDIVCRDYFSHLRPDLLWRKYCNGEIAMPIISLDPRSMKSSKGVAITDLAAYLDRRMEEARKECKLMTGRYQGALS